MYWMAKCTMWPNYSIYKAIGFLVFEVSHVDTPAFWIWYISVYIIAEVRLVKIFAVFSVVYLLEFLTINSQSRRDWRKLQTASIYRTQTCHTFCPKLEENFLIWCSLWKYVIWGTKEKSKRIHIPTVQIVGRVYVPWTVHHYTPIGGGAGWIDRDGIFLDAHVVFWSWLWSPRQIIVENCLSCMI